MDKSVGFHWRQSLDHENNNNTADESRENTRTSVLSKCTKGFGKNRASFTPYPHPEVKPGLSGTVELLVTNLDQRMDHYEMKKIIGNLFREHVMVRNVSVFKQTDGSIAAVVTVNGKSEAQFAISRLHKIKVGHKRIFISYSNVSYGGSYSLCKEIVSLLKSVPNGKTHLFKFREMFEKRYILVAMATSTEDKPHLPPAVINSHLNHFSFVPLLVDKFRLVPSKSTPARSVLFPSNRMSLLVVPPDEKFLLPSSLQEIEKFLGYNTNPFLLVVPAVDESDPSRTIKFAANLTFKMISQVNSPQIVSAWTGRMATRLITGLVLGGGDLEKIRQDSESVDEEPLENRLARANLYEDRVEALLDLDSFGSLSSLAAAGMDGKVANYFVDFFKEDRELY